MLYQIMDGTVSAGGVPICPILILKIKGTEKIAVAGKNGAGKTTLLRLLAGEISLDRDDKRNGPGNHGFQKTYRGYDEAAAFR